MKIKNLLKFNVFLFLLLGWQGYGQEIYTLGTCRELSRANFSKLKQVELLSSISTLKNAISESNYLPQINLKGQASYQSDVTSIDISIPGVDIESLSQDQYKLYVDIKQTIWDGGIGKAKRELENSGLDVALQKLEVEVNQLYVLVEDYFFKVLSIDKSTAIMIAQQEVLNKQIERFENLFSQGTARKKDKMKLQVEGLLLQQKIVELESQRKALLGGLGILIGKALTEDDVFEMDHEFQMGSDPLLRPEYAFFKMQQNQLLKGDELLQKSRNPLFFGFGQAGYGKPGFNMFKNEFSTYCIVGLGLSWKITDWKTSRRRQSINGFNRDIISTVERDFNQKQQMQLVGAKEQINKLKILIKTDRELVQMRKEITRSSASEMENGAITSTDYLIDLNAETVSQIRTELHEIQFNEAIVKYNSVLGNK